MVGRGRWYRGRGKDFRYFSPPVLPGKAPHQPCHGGRSKTWLLGNLSYYLLLQLLPPPLKEEETSAELEGTIGDLCSSSSLLFLPPPPAAVTLSSLLSIHVYGLKQPISGSVWPTYELELSRVL